MKIVQWTLAIIGIIFLAVVAIGFFLPSTFLVSRSIVVNAPASRVYDYVAEPRQWAKWSVWNQRDPNMEVHFSGPPFGQGAKWSWKSKSEGAGNMEFPRVEPNHRIEYALSFPEFGMKSAGQFTFEPDGPATKVTWTNGGDVGTNPLKHYFAALMDRMVGPDFEKGLENLKALAEKP
jgi:uncharacterized protein YndB with AHSA1/START domain